MRFTDNEFVKKYEKLVKSIACSYRSTGLSIEDLTQEGLIGLLEAKSRFQEEKDTSFTTYATFWIKNKILAYITKEYKATHKNVDEYQRNNQDSESMNLGDTCHVMADHSEKELNLPFDMPEEEKKVLNLYFVEKKTLTEISVILDMNRERIRQIKTKALRRCKITMKG